MFGIRRLRRENAILREALGWYATSSNWRKKGTNAKGAAAHVDQVAGRVRSWRACRFRTGPAPAAAGGSLLARQRAEHADTTDKD